MTRIIEVQNGHHLGDNIINFIFFSQIKKSIEDNNIIIHYYCLQQYHKNLLEFKCSENIKLFEYENKGYVLWQGGQNARLQPVLHWIEDNLCRMFNVFLTHHNLPISVNSFEYQDPDLFKRYENLDNKYKNIDILIINSEPLSSQYRYNKPEWDNFIINLSKKYIVATSAKVSDNILSLHDMSVKNIAAVALKVKKIIAINTGPSIPLYNTDILNNVDVIYLFGGNGNFKTRKIQCIQNLKQLSL